jgi:hypothetical protein
MGGWVVWLLLFLLVGSFSPLMANQALAGSGSSSVFSSASLSLDHVDDNEKSRCGNNGGGAYAFTALPDPWRRFDSSTAAPYPLPYFISNKIEADHALLSVYSISSMVASLASAHEDLEISGPVLAVLVMGRVGGEGICLDLNVFEARRGNLQAALRWRSKYAAAMVSCCFLGSAAFGSRSSAAFSPSTLQAEGRPLPPWLLALDSQLKVFFNLQLWRLLCTSVVGSRCGGPSGQFPGAAAVDHRWLLGELGGDGAGLDRFLQVRSEVLCANLLDLFVTFYYIRVLSVYCNSTAQN